MRQLAILVFAFICGADLHAQSGAVRAAQVVASGTVPDDATRASVLARLREVYGDAMVVDQITVGQVSAPPNWGGHLDKLVTPDLKQISRGQLTIAGSSVSVNGEVASDAVRQALAAGMTRSLNPTYTVTNNLRVAASGQGVLDAALANRIIEFESGKATLTPAGRSILNDMAAAMQKLKDRTVDIIGHTDNQGPRTANQQLSQARAEAVRSYLADSGIRADLLRASGRGADQPLNGNDSVSGRARNRRIEFRIAP